MFLSLRNPRAQKKGLGFSFCHFLQKVKTIFKILLKNTNGKGGNRSQRKKFLNSPTRFRRQQANLLTLYI